MRQRTSRGRVRKDAVRLGGALCLVSPPAVLAFALFSAADYDAMKCDASRTNAFYEAIDALCPGRVVLDLGSTSAVMIRCTGATALLALRAAEAGASRVYAVEVSEESAARAEERIAAAGLSQTVRLLLGDSKELELPERVDVVVHEILGEIASREGVAPSLRDAQRRHLKAAAGAWSIPARAATWLAPAAMPSAEYFAAYRKQSGALLLAPGPEERFLRLPQLPVEHCQLARGKLFEDLVWYGDMEPAVQQQRTLRFSVATAGVLAGFVFYITLECGGSADVVSSAASKSHWANPFCRVTQPVAVSPGDEIIVKTQVDLSPEKPRYAMEARLLRPGFSDEPLVPYTKFT